MVTRQTAGECLQGSEYVVDRYTATDLCTLACARQHGEGEQSGSLQRGCLADLIAFHGDPMTDAIAVLPETRPKFTIVGGTVVSDLDDLLERARTTSINSSA